VLTLDDVQAAARRFGDRVRRTPVLRSASLDTATGHHVFLKPENLQRAGSFKLRGALSRLTLLDADERARGVVAFSSGNHAQGVALAARMVDTSALVCMPTDAPASKLAATRGYGAEIVLYDRLKDDREALGRRIAAQTGRVLVPSYDDHAVMAGQGTAALELLGEVDDLDVLVAPVGGGGLMAGCSTAARGLAPRIRVFGVEADTANDTYLSFRRGERVSIAPPPTIADGIRSTTPGALTFPVLRAHVTDILLVSDAEIRAAVRFLALRARLVVEPSGAVGVAALLAGRLPGPPGARVGVILSGGNIDPELLVEILGDA
jgi:threo-3-hydroxy-L-aspartate ammonia-lyase